MEKIKAKKQGRRALAWILALALALSGLMLPDTGRRAQAAVSYDLTVKSGYSDSSVTMAKNQYNENATEYIGDVLFDVPNVAADKNALTANGITSMQVTLTVQSFTADTGAANQPCVMLYVQPGEDGGWAWNATDGTELSQGKEITLKYDFSNMKWNGGTTMGNLGLRFANCADGSTVSFRISSARLVAEGITEGGGGSGGETSEDVYAVVQKKSGGSEWAEYNYSVTNNTQQPVSGIQIKVPASGTVKDLQSWGCSVKYQNGMVIISHTAVLPAGTTYSCIGKDDIKFGFGGGASLGTPTVEFVYGTEGGGTSSSELNYPLTGEKKDVAMKDTPFGKHGKLSLQQVDGYSAPVIVDKNGNPYQLRGASTHGIQWDVGYNYVNKGAFQSLRDEWGVNMVRLACYVTQDGYTVGAQSSMDATIQRGVQAATDLGMYVIVDWHIHHEDPHTTKAQSKEFFTKYATMYKDYDNVIFEICNEPTGVQWYTGGGNDLYTYCKEIAGVIRNCGSDALIICGTNTWSQDVDDVAKKPLKNDGFENILYTFHFYSGSHYSDKMDKVKKAVQDGTPIFVTEFGICDASGNGGYDTANADAWISLCDQHNISFACWSCCNKNESASYLLPSCSSTTGGWLEKDLSTTGLWLVNTYRAHQEKEEEKEQESLGGIKGITLDQEKLKLTTNGSIQEADLKATVEMENGGEYTGSVTWKTSDANVATVSNGTVKAKGSGEAVITAKAGTFTAECAVTVTTAVEGIGLNYTKLSLEGGESKKLTAVFTPTRPTNRNVTWSSSDEKVAAVDENGMVFAAGKGTATITVTTEEGGFKASCEVTVASSTTVTGVTLDRKSAELFVGDKITLSASVQPDDADDKSVTWKSSDSTVASVADGVVTAKKAGEATITVTTAVNNRTDKCLVKVVRRKYEISALAALALKDRTKDSLTVQFEGTLADGVVAEYQLNDGEWQTEAVFTGLQPATCYRIRMRYQENEEYEASDIVAEGSFYTKTADPYEIDLGRLDEEGYLELLEWEIKGDTLPTVRYDAENNTLELLQENENYTITGKAPDITVIVQEGEGGITMKDSAFSSLDVTQAGDVAVTVEGTNQILSVTENEPAIKTGAGTVLTLTGDGHLAAEGNHAAGIGSQGTLIIENGEYAVTAGTGSSAIETDTVKLLGGVLDANVSPEAVSLLPAVQVAEDGSIVLDNTVVTSNAEHVYSKDPVDLNGESLVFVTITYKDGATGTILQTSELRKGAELTLRSIEETTGYRKMWTDGEKTYQSGEKISSVQSDMIFWIEAEEIRATALSLEYQGKKLTENSTITLDITKGDTAELKAVVIPDDALHQLVEWSSSNDKTAVVSDGGVVTPKGTGKAVITAKLVADETIFASVEIEVKETVQPTPSPTASADVNESPEPTISADVSESPEPTASADVNESPEPTASVDVNESPEPTASAGVNESPEPTASADVNESPKPTASADINESPEPTASADVNESPKPTTSADINESPEPTASADVNESPKPTTSADVNESPKPTASAGASGSPKPTASAGVASTNIPKPTFSAAPSATPDLDPSEDETVGGKKPGRVSVRKVAAGKKKLTIRWKAVKGAEGYQVFVSRKKNFAGAKKVKVKGTGKKISGLKRKKKYYVKVRAYKKVDGQIVYGKWSKVKSKKVK